jgi:hypothetical protein
VENFNFTQVFPCICFICFPSITQRINLRKPHTHNPASRHVQQSSNPCKAGHVSLQDHRELKETLLTRPLACICTDAEDPEDLLPPARCSEKYATCNGGKQVSSDDVRAGCAGLRLSEHLCIIAPTSNRTISGVIKLMACNSHAFCWNSGNTPLLSEQCFSEVVFTLCLTMLHQHAEPNPDQR